MTLVADEDLHGYAIMRRVEEQTEGRMRLGPGTLYSSIQALLEEGFIEEVDGYTQAEPGHDRRRYKGTESLAHAVNETQSVRTSNAHSTLRSVKSSYLCEERIDMDGNRVSDRIFMLAEAKLPSERAGLVLGETLICFRSVLPQLAAQRGNAPALLSILLTCSALQIAHAQQFDAASVKRVALTQRSNPGLRQSVAPTRINITNASLINLVMWAYNLSLYQISGPAWTTGRDVLFEVSATTATPASEASLKMMMQSLLATRLGVKIHREARELPSYALIVSQGGVKMMPSSPDKETKFVPKGPYSYSAENISMKRLAEIVSPPWTSRNVVVDQTGLSGGYDFTLDLAKYILDPTLNEPILDPSGRIDIEGAVLRSLPEQLGLQLRSTRTRVDVLIIDEAEKTPSEN